LWLLVVAVEQVAIIVRGVVAVEVLAVLELERVYL
jgi:hypothetical protein